MNTDVFSTSISIDSPAPPEKRRYESRTQSLSETIAETWERRELLFFLAWREILLRYKSTSLGIAWALFQPVSATLVFSVLFGKFAKLSSDGVPYAAYAFAGLLPWQFFLTVVNHSSRSLIQNQAIIRKVYFPRILFPLSNTLVALVDFSVSLALLLALMLAIQTPITLKLALLPVAILWLIATSVSVGIWLSVLTVRFRDLHHAIPILVQLLFFLTPVAYSPSIVPEPWSFFMGLNPMVGVVDAFRSLFFDSITPNLSHWAWSFGMTLTLFISGLKYFAKAERTLEDSL